MSVAERRVLHILPHPGGGGETYVELLSEMEGYHAERLFLAPSSRPQPALARGVGAATRAAQRCQLIHIHGEVAAALCLPMLAMCPSVVTLHGLHLLRRVAGLRRRLAVLNLRLILRSAGRTICVSRSEHEALLRAVGVQAGRRAVLVPNGVKTNPPARLEERKAIRAELGLEDSEVVALWVGSLDERKGRLTATRAPRQAGVTRLMGADGPLRPLVEAQADKRVRVLAPRRDLRRLFAAADLFILTSSREGLSFALLEALAAGLPAVVTDAPENVEAIGEAGLAAPFGVAAGFADAVMRVAPVRAQLAETARARAEDLFPADRMIHRTRAVYDDVLGERQPRTRPLPTAQ